MSAFRLFFRAGGRGYVSTRYALTRGGPAGTWVLRERAGRVAGFFGRRRDAVRFAVLLERQLLEGPEGG